MDLKKYALEYAAKGWPIFPCKPGGKTPITANGVKDATASMPRVEDWWSHTPDANIGMHCIDYFVLDVDNKEGKVGDESLAKLVDQYGHLPNTVLVETWSGGYHFYFKQTDPPIRNSAGKLGRDLDIRGEGGYVILPPSVIEDSEYLWDDRRQVVCEPPEWLVKELQHKPKGADTGFDLPDKISSGQRNDYMFKYACKLRQSGLERPEILSSMLTVNTTRLGQPLTNDEIDKILGSACRYDTEGDAPGSPRWDYIGKTKKLRNTYNNCKNFLELDEEIKGLFKLNEFTGDIEIARYVPWLGSHTGKMMSDTDEHMIKEYLRGKGFEPMLGTLHEAIVTNSKQCSYHPVKQYLEALTWDGEPRLDSWLHDYLGTEESTYTTQVGAKTLIAACARIDKPGIKFDHMLILEGEQSIGKTSAVSALGGSWYRDININARDKDTIDAMRGGWIIEVSEMVCFRKQEIEALKSFVSRQVDRVRLAYRRNSEDYPRQCIFIGTINPDALGYLKDTTGNRRYWPVTVGQYGELSLSQLQADRDHLWAEAYMRYKKGDSLHLTDSVALQEAKQAQEGREETDGWQERIESWLIKQTAMHHDRPSSIEVWEDCLEGDTSRFERKQQQRIANVMRKLGYTSRSVKVDGKVERRYVLE